MLDRSGNGVAAAVVLHGQNGRLLEPGAWPTASMLAAASSRWLSRGDFANAIAASAPTGTSRASVSPEGSFGLSGGYLGHFIFPKVKAFA